MCISHSHHPNSHLSVCHLSGLVGGVDFLPCQELPLGHKWKEAKLQEVKLYF